MLISRFGRRPLRGSWDEVLKGPNPAPIPDAGIDQTITLPAAAVLEGIETGPPYADSINWSKASGPGTVTFGDVHGLATTATFSVAGVYVLRLTTTFGAVTTFDEVEVTVLPAPGNPALNTSLTFWLPLSEASGDRVCAKTAKAWTQNGTVASAADPTFGTVASFGGVNGNWLRRENDADIAIPANQSFSVACWVNITTPTALAGLFTRIDSTTAGTRQFSLDYQSGNVKPQFTRNKASGAAFVRPNDNMPAGEWHFVVGVSDFETQQVGISIDGGAFVYAACTDHTKIGNYGWNVGAYYGNGANSSVLNGKLHNVSLWRNLALSDADAAWLYNGGAGRLYADIQALS